MRTKRLLSRYIFVVSVFYYLFFVFSISQAQKFVFDFENDADLRDWEIIDESPKNIGKGAPSRWFITNGPIKGKALYQSSNIWGTKDDSCLMRTFIREYRKGYVDIQLYAQKAYFDNIIIESIWAVDPDKKVSTTWAQAKANRNY